MKAQITIHFEEINGAKVTASLLKKVPMLKYSTKRTCKTLCRQIERFFSDNKIKIKTEMTLE
jgi:hypothetical protein